MPAQAASATKEKAVSVTEIRLGNVSPVETHMVEVTKADTEGDSPKAPNARVEKRGGKNVYLNADRQSVKAQLGITDKGKDGPDGTVTVVNVPSGIKLSEMVQTVSSLYTQHHSDDPPEWVEVEGNDVWAEVLAEEFSVDKAEAETLGVDQHDCKVGRPKGWKSAAPDAPTIAGGAPELFEDLDEIIMGMLEPWEMLNLARLRTNAGADFQSRVMGDTASTGTGSYAAANYIALSTDATAPAAGDTTLTGELTASGLGRAVATYAHTNGTVTYTLTKAFTSSDATPRTIQKIAVFNAASTGTMVFETALASPPTLQSGDSLTVTETVTLT